MRASAPRLVPVFPLPDVVLLPGVRLPLHVFELRYRTLVRDALANGRTLAIATLAPGWEHDYLGSPAFHPIGCLATFEQAEWLPDDRYDLLVQGTMRVRFGAVRREFPYRVCDVELLPPAPYDEGDPLTLIERSALEDVTRRAIGLGPAAWSSEPEMRADARFEEVVNAVAHALRLDTPARLELIALDSVIDRSRRLREHLGHRIAAPRREPGGDSRLN